MATPALNMERPWIGKDQAATLRCLSNKVSLLQYTTWHVALTVDYVGTGGGSARLQEVQGKSVSHPMVFGNANLPFCSTEYVTGNISRACAWEVQARETFI